MKKHTPGPWKLGDIDITPFGRGFVRSIDADTHGELATVVWQMEDDLDDNQPSTECEANANLIAAAPELLESLVNLVGLAELGAARLDKYHAALANAEAVIAKARGES